MVGLSKADFCGASAAPSKRAPRRQRETVRNILLFIVMDGAGGAGGAREEGCATGEPGTGSKNHRRGTRSPGRGAFRPTFPQNGYALERREVKNSGIAL